MSPDAQKADDELGEVQLGLLTRLLPLAVVLSAIVLFASELMTTFEFTPEGGEVQLEQQAADRHGNALMVIAVFALVALVIAIFSASKPAATAVAVAGIAALGFFLIVDLPDANATGTLDTDQSFIDAEAVPREGFYLELLGALGLLVSGVALATMTPAQLNALGPKRKQRDEERSKPEPKDKPEPKQDEESTKRRPPRRAARTRQRR